ncbi:hypothetical protein shim_10640 [Shimia sp. SK013]|uniref:hypothetical protein n=1 Tax=Shimia sp. SK013 TaxID=1389006 RepID=UPI0006B5C01E|nr:hypothetical protein [Shimia sp. SK013]KPA22776.1 hypothetical protein shim_10640 [Shimia sp. SK013]
MKFFATGATALCLLTSASFAQTHSSAILVMDGSGPMSGQIDSTARITIASEGSPVSLQVA